MVERKEVEALLAHIDQYGLQPPVPTYTISSLCRAWLALDNGVRAVVRAVGDDPETGEPRIYATTTRSALRDGQPLACRPVRIVPEANDARN